MSQSPDAYRTVKSTAEGEFKDRGSKFIAYVFPMQNEEDFHTQMAILKSDHLKARHHCWAYRLLNADMDRSNDDGEPSGTAGKPILNQLLSKEVVNTGCIVVRYFGGTKLGASGLIQAYKLSAQYALEQVEIITLYQTVDLVIAFSYDKMGVLMDALKYLNLNITEKDFSASPKITAQVNQSEVEQTITKIKAKLLNRSTSDISDDTEVVGVKFLECE